MWCVRCHYGSEVCQFESVGGGRKSIQRRCPQCGLVSADHLTKYPFLLGTRTLHGTKGAEKRRPRSKKMTQDQELKIDQELDEEIEKAKEEKGGLVL